MPKLIVAAFILLFLSSPAYAYLDPGTGSVLVQGLVAGFAVAAAAVAAIWTRIRQLLSGGRKPAPTEPRDTPQA